MRSVSKQLAIGMWRLPFDPEPWAVKAYWTPSEIAALSLGLDPAEQRIAKESNATDAVESNEYLNRLDTIKRAIHKNQIEHDCSPDQAIAWLDQFSISYPKPLKDAVEKFYPVKDWKKACLYFIAKHTKTIEELRKQIALEQGTEPHKEKPIAPKRVASYERIIAALAYAAYKYDPSSNYSDVPSSIADDMAEIGLKLSQPVISSIVKEACINQGFVRLPDLE